MGNEPYVSAYLKSNSAIEQCSVVYMFPFEAFSKKKVEVVKKVEKIVGNMISLFQTRLISQQKKLKH